MTKINSLTIATALVGVLVGAGFASGQELMQFFGKYGMNGLAASFFVGVGLALISIVVLLTARRIGTQSYEVVATPPVPALRWGVNILLTIFSLTTVMIMVSGAGAAVETLLGVPPLAVNIAMALILLAAGWFGSQGILNALNIVVPVMTVIMLLVAAMGIFTGDTAFGESQAFGTFPLTQCVASAGTYISYNFTGALIVLSAMGVGAPDKKTIYNGCILGGVILGLMAVLVCSSIIKNYDILVQSSMPMLDIALSQSKVLAYLYGGVLLIAIFSTAAGMVFGLLERFAQYPVAALKNRRLMLVCIILAGLFGSKLGFVTLVGTIYPIQGYINLGILALMLYNFAVCHKKTVPAN